MLTAMKEMTPEYSHMRSCSTSYSVYQSFEFILNTPSCQVNSGLRSRGITTFEERGGDTDVVGKRRDAKSSTSL